MTYLRSQSRSLHLPNGFDVWGFHGATVTRESTTNTDTTLFSPNNLNALGYASASGTAAFRQANQVSGRSDTLRLTTGASSGNLCAVFGCNPLDTVPFQGSYSTRTLEAFVTPTSAADVDIFVGFCSNGSADPQANSACGVIFDVSDDATNWQTYTRDGVSETSTSTGVALSTAAVNRLKVAWTTGSVQVTVNGTVASAVTSTFPTAELTPQIIVITRTAGAKVLHIEHAFDYLS
jgi:hypothetical protein